jgi:sarcosine oxidase subunit alpha
VSGDPSVAFTWNGQRLTGQAGDSIAVALWRNDILAIGCSRKRHRPMGASGAYLQGVLVQVNGRPHVRADQCQISPDIDIRQQNVWPTAGFDLLRLLRFVPSSWTRGGFERPRFLPSGTRRFELWERLLMFLAGEVTLRIDAAPQIAQQRGKRIDCDVVVVGGGPAGRVAANEAAATGARTCLVSRSASPGSYSRALGVALPVLDSRVTLLSELEAVGVYRQGTVVLAAPPRDAGPAPTVLVTKQLILATGRRSLPPLIPGNDIPGVMDSHLAVQVAPALRSEMGPTVVVGNGAEQVIAEFLRANGVTVVATASVQSLEWIKGQRRVSRVRIGGKSVACKVLVHAGPWISDPSLSFQSSARGSLRLTDADALPHNVAVVGSAAAKDDMPHIPSLDSITAAAVCPCMDVTVGELLSHIHAGETHVEVLKRSTSCGMGPCQGFPCWESMRAVIKKSVGAAASDDRPTHRPPRRGITVEQAAALDGLLELETT